MKLSGASGLTGRVKCSSLTGPLKKYDSFGKAARTGFVARTSCSHGVKQELRLTSKFVVMPTCFYFQLFFNDSKVKDILV